MSNRKAQISLRLDEFRMLKLLEVESGEPVEEIVRDLLRIVHESIDHAYETGEVPPGTEGCSLQVFKALHLKRLGGLTEPEFNLIVADERLHPIVHKVFEAEGLTERRKVMQEHAPTLSREAGS